MSATPVINNLYEAKALLELVKGVEFSDLQTYSSIANASAMHEKLILYGIRYRPQYAQTIETTYTRFRALIICRVCAVEEGRDSRSGTGLAGCQTRNDYRRVEERHADLHALSHGPDHAAAPRHRKSGLHRRRVYGRRQERLAAIHKGKVDVLIGSVPVGTGVDGLQYVCNRLIIVSLPWTSAEYEQLVGRLYRQGSVFDKVEVIIPQVVLRAQRRRVVVGQAAHASHPVQENAGRCRARWRDSRRRTGFAGNDVQASARSLASVDRARRARWCDHHRARETARPAARRRRPPHSASLRRSLDDECRINTAYSQTTHERLKQNPEEWYLYHTLYREARQTWAEIPYEKIAKSLKRRPDWVVGDFGCGEAQLARCCRTRCTHSTTLPSTTR